MVNSRSLWLLLAGMLCFYNASAFLYGEHKLIGDRAFIQAVEALQNESESVLLRAYLDNIAQRNGAGYIFPGLGGTQTAYTVTYGMLNGLSGDHARDPFLLAELIKEEGSKMSRIILLHQKYMDQGWKAAPDAELVKADFDYAVRAALNLCHFYAYGQSFEAQLKGFDKKKLMQAAASKEEMRLFIKNLSHTNAINMYVCIHLIAVSLAEKAGAKAGRGDKAAGELLQNALLLNGFADHFLEDAFSAGHLVVNRSMLASFTNNKALHDFYSEQGTMVMNRKGEVWRAYGDGKFEGNNVDGARTIKAVQLSVGELFHAFSAAANGDAFSPFWGQVPDVAAPAALFLIGHISALSLIPVPYNSELEKVLVPELKITDTLRKTNQLLYYRNFIRSRVGNSFVIGQLNTIFRDESVTGYEFRINAMNFNRRYACNAAGGKRGMLDHWHGYTAAYQLMKARRPGGSGINTLITGGLRSNFDWWFNDKKFLGLYSYLETGLRFDKKTAEFVFAPSAGINLGSLFQVNYYNMPGWLRIPVMYLLPLKVRYGAVFSFKQLPQQQLGAELDLFF